MTEASSSKNALIGRTDKENNRVILGDTAIVLRGEDGRKIPVDHASAGDGYVAFTETNLHLTFEEVEDDE